MRDGVISHITAGALGGAAGTALLSRGTKASRRLPERLRPTPLVRDPGDFVASKLESLRGQPLSQGTRHALARGLRWGYGVTGGVLLGLITSRRRVGRLGAALRAGALLGTAAWAVGYAGWLPAAKLAPPLRRQGARHIAASLLGHIAFGLVAAAPIFVLDRRATAEPRWRRALRRLG